MDISFAVEVFGIFKYLICSCGGCILFVVVLAKEVSDTVCELFRVVVAVSLVSFSSFTDVTVTVVWFTAEISALSTDSDTVPQAVSITVQSIEIYIAFFISSRSLSSNISHLFVYIQPFCKSSAFVTIYTA